MEKIKDLKKHLEMYGGATLDATTGAHALLSHGFMVSLEGTETKTTLKRFNKHYLKKALKVAKKLNCFCGLWVDDGVLFLDRSVCVNTLTEALSLARLNKQLAIYDNAKKESIYL